MECETNSSIQVILEIIQNNCVKVSALELYKQFVSEYEIKLNKLGVLFE